MEITDSEEPLDWEEIANGQRVDQNQDRWAALLKGFGGLVPGALRFNPSEIASKLI